MKASFSFVALVLPALLCMSSVACGGSSTTSNANPGADGGTSGNPDVFVPAAGSFTVQFGPIQVPPATERTQCVVLPLGNKDPVHIGTIHNVLGTSSHHMIVYRVSDTVAVTTPFDCKPFTDTLDPTKGSTLIVTQKKDDTLTLPPNVGYTLSANQFVRLEMHYINPGATTTTLTSTSTLTPIPDSEYKDEAGFLFIGDPDITLPPNAKTTLGPIFFPLPAVYADANFFAITGHEHQLGTNVTISTAANSTDPGTPVYDVPNWLWSEPSTVVSTPPFKVPAGGGFTFTCDWNNTTSSTVSFGESANNEMCFFWAYYYPSNGSKVCVHSNKIMGGVDFCCPGSTYCQYL